MTNRLFGYRLLRLRLKNDRMKLSLNNFGSWNLGQQRQQGKDYQLQTTTYRKQKTTSFTPPLAFLLVSSPSIVSVRNK